MLVMFWNSFLCCFLMFFGFVIYMLYFFNVDEEFMGIMVLILSLLIFLMEDVEMVEVNDILLFLNFLFLFDFNKVVKSSGMVDDIFFRDLKNYLLSFFFKLFKFMVSVLCFIVVELFKLFIELN